MELTYDYLMNSEEFAEMRAYWPFEDEAEFEDLFGYRNGTRMNKILLAFITSKDVFNFDHGLVCCSSMQSLKRNCMRAIRYNGGDLLLIDSYYKLDGYRTDDMSGICKDGDLNSVRFIHDGRVAKMRAGKLFRKIILESEFGRVLPEQVVTWLCEEFTSSWNAFTSERAGTNYMLVTGLNSDLTFADIYGDGSYHADYFGSCMTGEKRGAFYEKCMEDVYPAALVEKDNPKNIIARCVVYNHVTDVESGKVYRLAERQYTCRDDVAKRMLVNALEKAGLIDGHKAVGASCHDGWNFVLNDGTSLSDRKLFVNVDFSECKTLSYQDSFKYFVNADKKAYNFQPSRYDVALNSTARRVPIYFDSYHGIDVFNETVDVWVDGKRMTCDSRNTGDFIRWNGDYFHREKDAVSCPHCGAKMGAHHVPENRLSRLLGKAYCCLDCKEEAETAVTDVKFFFSAFDREYTKKASDLTTVLVWCTDFVSNRGYIRGYRKMSILKSTLESLILLGEALKYKGAHYIDFDSQKKLPFGVEQTGNPQMF